MKKILILGGTQFIGRNLVKKLIATNEYDITLFNRQKTGADLFPHLNKIKGDRETDDVQQIANENWDFVIDLSCYLPATLSSVLKQIKQPLEKYIFISTCSVYDNPEDRSELRDENAPILSCDAEQAKEKTLKFYGNKKAECERILEQSNFNHVILRPALVIGPHDHTDRFYYWLYQVRHMNPLIMPEMGKRKLSITYVDDLVGTTMKLLRIDSPSKVYNMISYPQNSIDQFVTIAGKLMNKSPKLIDAPAEFLKENKIGQWMDMPLWINGDYFTYSNQRLIDELNINLTSFEEATKATVAYYNERGWDAPIYGMTEERRQELLTLLAKHE